MLRMQIQFSAKDKELSKALANLEALKTAAKAQLGILGVEESSIEFGDPRVGQANANEQQQMQMMIMQRMRGGARASETTSDEDVNVTMALTADWKIAGSSISEKLLFVHDLQKRITEANLAGRKDKEQLSLEEQELMEEMQDMGMYGGYGQPQQKPGEPSYSFVRLVSADQRTELMKEAFEKAQSDAQQLASAASVTLGDLSSLSYTINQPGNENNPYAQYAQMFGYPMGSAGEQNKNEAISSIFGELAYAVNVIATFELQKR
ncbi:MAG: SIMPL domain-containing protein [Planctomycetes bacterium]|nr:SIMPL domain-containing protein [Planctomycetota bacterium]